MQCITASNSATPRVRQNQRCRTLVMWQGEMTSKHSTPYLLTFRSSAFAAGLLGPLSKGI